MTTLTSSQAIAGLYVALLGRAPDASGFDFWLRALDSAGSREAVAQTMLDAPETTAAQPSAQTGTQFVVRFYTDVLGRAPDADGLAFWAAALNGLGGVDSTAARAALVLQIVDALSVPMTSQPAGMSNADYERALADRALFANKIEFGVHFASVLKSDDLALAKVAMTLITSDPASVQAATDLATGVTPEPPVVNPPVIPPPTITVADTPIDIANKFAAYQGIAATVDARDMAADQLEAVAAAIDKVASIRDLRLVLADISDAATAGLLGKALADSVTVDATGATANELAAILTHIAKLASAGIGGALHLSAAQTSSQLGNLLGARTDDTATVTIDADGMDTDQLVAVSSGIAKVDSIGNLHLTLADLTDEVASRLLAKAEVASAAIDVTGASDAALAALATRIDRIADDGITGAITLTRALSTAELSALTGAKLATAATVAVDANGMDVAMLTALDANASRIDSVSGLQATLAAFNATAPAGLLAKSNPGSAQVDVTGARAEQLSLLATLIDRIAIGGLTGTLSLDANRSAAELTALLAERTSDAATVNVNADGMDSTRLEAVAQGMAKVDSLVDLPQLLLAELSDAATASLLLTASGRAVTIEATSASAAQLSSLVTHISKIATGGITGTLALGGTRDADALAALLGDKTAASATIDVDASGMGTAQLEAVGQRIAKVDTLSKLPPLALGALSATAAGNLLAKTSDSALTVDTSGADAVQLSALATNIDKVALDGITGTLVLGNALSASELTALLGGKTNDAAVVQVNAANMSMIQLEAVAAAIGKVDTLSNLPRLELANLQDQSTAALLAKASSGITVLATGASDEELSLLVTYNSKLATSGITGDVTLGNARSDGELTILLGAKMSSAANVTVDATGMSAAKLVAVSGGIANVDRIAGLQLVLADVNDAATTSLLSKAVDGTVRVNGTGASNSEFNALAANVGKLADDGITGAFTLTSAQTAANLTSLLGAKASAAATVTVDATSMIATQLTAVGQGIDKVDVVTSLTFRMQDVGDSITAGLLSKSAANSVRIDVNSASTAEVTTLLGNLGKVANGGLSGVLNVSYTSLDAGINTMLSSKIAAFSALHVTGTAARDIMSFPGLTTSSINLRIDPAGGGDLINLGNSSATLLLSDRDSVRSGNLNVNNTTTENLLRVEGTGTLSLHFSTAANAFGDGLAFQHGAVSAYGNTQMSGVTHTFNTLGDVVSSANTEFSKTFGASTNATPMLYTFEIQGGAGLQGKFLFLNDMEAPLTIDDLIMTYAINNLAMSFVTF